MTDAKITHKITNTIICVVLTFGLIFDLSFKAMPSLTTGRVCLVIMFLLYGKRSLPTIETFTRKFNLELSILIFYLLYSMIIVLIVGDPSFDYKIYSKFFWFLAYSLFGAVLFVSMSKFKYENAMMYYLLAIATQSIFVFISMLSPEFREWLNNNINTSSNIDIENGIRFTGFSNFGGSDLSLQLSLGTFAAFILLYNENTFLKRYLLFFLICFITISNVFVGRLGLLISAVVTIVAFTMMLRKNYILIFISFLVFYVLFDFNSFVSDLADFRDAGNNVRLDLALEWASDILSIGNSDTLQVLNNQYEAMPPLNLLELIMGTARISNPDGSNFSGHDSGYIQLIYAIGFPLALIFYWIIGIIFIKLTSTLRDEKKYFAYFMICILYICELKEPFIFKYTYPFFLLSYLILMNTNDRLKSYEFNSNAKKNK